MTMKSFLLVSLLVLAVYGQIDFSQLTNIDSWCSKPLAVEDDQWYKCTIELTSPSFKKMCTDCQGFSGANLTSIGGIRDMLCTKDIKTRTNCAQHAQCMFQKAVSYQLNLVAEYQRVANACPFPGSSESGGNGTTTPSPLSMG